MKPPRLLSLFFALLSLSACESTPDVDIFSTLKISPQQDIEISGDAQTVVFNIETSRSWTIELQSSARGWISIPDEELRGTGNKTIHATVSRNLGSMRFGKISIIPDDAKKVVAMIEQNTLTRTTLYSNRFQGDALTQPTAFGSYWAESEAKVTGDGSYYSETLVSAPDDMDLIYVNGDRESGSYSHYAFASGGNYIALKGADTRLRISDIVAEGASSLMLTFGCRTADVADFDPAKLRVFARYDNSDTPVEIAYTRQSGTGWDMAVAEFEVSDIRMIGFEFVTSNGGYLLDDINLYTSADCEISYKPIVTTGDIANEEITFNKATIVSGYVYPPYPPVIRERGIVWRPKGTPESESMTTASPFEGDAEAGEFATLVRPLKKLTTYLYKAYVRDDLGNLFYGEEKEFTTKDFEQPEGVPHFRDVFTSISESGKLYIDNGWEPGNMDLPAESNWHTVTADDPQGPGAACIRIQPNAEISSLQILPVLDVAAAEEAALYVNYARMPGAGTGKLELVALADYQGEDYDLVAWEHVADLTLDADDDIRWLFRRIDLGGYAGKDCVMLALRYTGSQAGYCLRLVRFGKREPVGIKAPEYDGIMQQGVANQNVRLSIPYKYGLGESVDMTVTVNDPGLRAEVRTPQYSSGDGDFYNSIECLISGTPSNAGTVQFKIVCGNQTVTRQVNIYNKEGRMVAFNATVNANAPGVGTCRIAYASGLSLTRIYSPTKPDGQPAAVPNFIFSAGQGNQFQTGPGWDPVDIGNPKEYVLITAPWLQSSVSGGTIELKTTFRAWNPAWIKDGRAYSFRISYATSADPQNWKPVDDGGLIPIAKSGNTSANNIPVTAKILFDGVEIPRDSEIYFRISMEPAGVIAGNISIVNNIQVSHIK